MRYVDPKNPDQVRALVSGALEWPDPPWKAAASSILFYQDICQSICSELGLVSRIESNSYGSGYASFIDAWFYQDRPAFRTANPHDVGQSFTGLFVLLNENVPFYAMGEGQKSWSGNSGSSYLPSVDSVDVISSPSVFQLNVQVERSLSKYGMTRLRASDLKQRVPIGIEIETNLSDGELKMFDAYFNWMD